jgi:uncharacterized membrane protein
MVDRKDITTIAKYLQERGWIAGADANYGIFVITT